MKSKSSSWKEKVDPAFNIIIRKFVKFFDSVKLISNTGRNDKKKGKRYNIFSENKDLFRKLSKTIFINLASKYMNSVIPRLDRGIQSFQWVLECPVKPDNDDFLKYFLAGLIVI
jgi:hypothetical protein